MLFSSKHKETLSLILDIQSCIVRSSLVLTHADKKIDIIWTDHAEMPYKPETDGAGLIKAAFAALDIVMRNVIRHLHDRASIEGSPRKVSSVHYVLSSPWIISRAANVSLDFGKKTAVTRDIIEKLIRDERENALDGHANNIHNTQDAESVKIVEEKAFDVRINGYPVPFWEGVSGERVEVSFASSVAGAGMIERLTQACEAIAPADKVSFHSSVLLQYIGIGAIVPHIQAYALIHVHGELTDAVIVNQGNCVFFGSYPFGTRTAIRKIAAAGHTSRGSAESLWTLETNGHLDGEQNLHIRKVVANMGTEWTKAFDKITAPDALKCGMPGLAVISARSHEDFFIKHFKDAHPEMHIEKLSTDSLIPPVAFTKEAEHLRLVGLYAVALGKIL